LNAPQEKTIILQLRFSCIVMSIADKILAKLLRKPKTSVTTN
jgi:hypothetical protein